jgi:hypothetical protein
MREKKINLIMLVILMTKRVYFFECRIDVIQGHSKQAKNGSASTSAVQPLAVDLLSGRAPAIIPAIRISKADFPLRVCIIATGC